LILSIDWNINIMACAVWVIRGKELHLVDGFNGDFDTEALMKSIQARYPNHKCIVHADASGSARKTSSGGKTDVTITESYGYKVYNLKGNPLVQDRINSFNSLIKSASGVRKLFFVQNKRTKPFIEALERHTFGDNGQPIKDHKYDDFYDALSYGAYPYSPLTAIKPVQNTRR